VARPAAAFFTLVDVTVLALLGGCSNQVIPDTVPDAGPVIVPGGGEGEGEGEGEGDADCPNADVPALAVRVVDGTTRFTLCNEVTVTASEGAFVATLTTSGQGEACRHIGVEGRSGTYTVTVTGPDHATRTANEVAVAADACDDPRATTQLQLEVEPL
jgi:hypothetical protein